MKILELFAGTRSIGKAFEARGQNGSDLSMEKSCETCGHYTVDHHCKLGDHICLHDINWIPKYAPDNVNHPAHYEQSCSLECIQVMELVFGANAVRDFCLCNAFKYMWRYKNKNGLEDLKKANWYLDYVKDYVPVGDPTYKFMGELLDYLMEKEEK